MAWVRSGQNLSACCTLLSRGTPPPPPVVLQGCAAGVLTVLESLGDRCPLSGALPLVGVPTTPNTGRRVSTHAQWALGRQSLEMSLLFVESWCDIVVSSRPPSLFSLFLCSGSNAWIGAKGERHTPGLFQRWVGCLHEHILSQRGDESVILSTPSHQQQQQQPSQDPH